MKTKEGSPLLALVGEFRLQVHHDPLSREVPGAVYLPPPVPLSTQNNNRVHRDQRHLRTPQDSSLAGSVGSRAISGIGASRRSSRVLVCT